MSNNYKMLAKTMFGFEELLEKEPKVLGALNIEIGVRRVSFEGDKGFMYKANLCLRTAIKILKPVHSFRVRSEQDLYDKVYGMYWNQYLSYDHAVAVGDTVNSDLFNHSLYIALKTKDAIADKFRAQHDRRPSVDLKYPDLRINVHIQKNECTISLDSSGQSLHQRGYKTATNIAPINEVL